MDKLFFRNFKVNASVGILPAEKQHKQVLRIDLEFAVDASKVVTLADTVNYALVRESILEVIQAKHYDLLEVLAEILCQHLIKQFNLNWLQLSLQKPDIFDDMDGVGIVIERSCAAPT